VEAGDAGDHPQDHPERRDDRLPQNHAEKQRQRLAVDGSAAEGHNRRLARPADEDREPHHRHRPIGGNDEPERVQRPPEELRAHDEHAGRGGSADDDVHEIDGEDLRIPDLHEVVRGRVLLEVGDRFQPAGGVDVGVLVEVDPAVLVTRGDPAVGGYRQADGAGEREDGQHLPQVHPHHGGGFEPVHQVRHHDLPQVVHQHRLVHHQGRQRRTADPRRGEDPGHDVVGDDLGLAEHHPRLGDDAGEHQNDGQEVVQQPHRIHSYRPSNFSRCSGVCLNSTSGIGSLTVR